MLEEPHVIGESSMNLMTIFMDKVLDHMDEMSPDMDSLRSKNAELGDKFTKLEEDHENLKLRYEYIDLKYGKAKKKVNNFEAMKDQGLDEITKLQKSLDDARNQISIRKKVIGQGLVGGTANVKVKELDPYDGMWSAKSLSNFVWDVSKYVEFLEILDEEVMKCR